MIQELTDIVDIKFNAEIRNFGILYPDVNGKYFGYHDNGVATGVGY